MIGKVVVVKLGSGHSIVGILMMDKWFKVRIDRPFAIERRMDVEGNMADVLVPYVPYIKETGIWVNKSSIVSIYEVNEVFTSFYESTLKSYLKNDAGLSDKAVQDFLDDEELERMIQEEEDELNKVKVNKDSVLVIPSSNTVH